MPPEEQAVRREARHAADKNYRLRCVTLLFDLNISFMEIVNMPGIVIGWRQMRACVASSQPKPRQTTSAHTLPVHPNYHLN
jgi:hypothetical protein